MKKVPINVPIADGDGDEAQLFDGWGLLVYAGTWDGATATPKLSWDGGTTWIAAKDAQDVPIAPTANAYFFVPIAGEPLIRHTVSGSSGATDVECEFHYGSAATKPR